MTELNITVEGADELAAALELAPAEVSTSLFEVLDDSAQRLQDDWRRGARRSAGSHGKYYPRSITHDLHRADGAIWADIGPDSSMPQGGMGRGFEYGSVHTAPHPDGAVAFAGNAQRFYDAVGQRVDEIIRQVLL